MHRLSIIIAMLFALAAQGVTAQVAVPRLPPVGGVLDGLRVTVSDTADPLLEKADELARDRLRTIDRLVRRNRDQIERDTEGAPARRGVLLLVDPSAATLQALAPRGFSVGASEEIEGLDLALVSIRLPSAMTLSDAQELVLRIAPDADISPDHLYFTAGYEATPAPQARPAPRPATIVTHIGVIDGAPTERLGIANVRGFASGAPRASDHGSAVAGLLVGEGARLISVADVYGSDKAGGNALAIARALGWLVSEGARVVSISLVGPKNAVLARAISTARRKGVVIVAAVGNDGPAAPPAYPASYAGVIAVTGVDRRDRALIEAGRALHLDYAAPGEVRSYDARGKHRRVRGTSFAAPLVAVRAAAAIAAGRSVVPALDREAKDLGRKGHDNAFGRGLLCATCAQRD